MSANRFGKGREIDHQLEGAHPAMQPEEEFDVTRSHMQPSVEHRRQDVRDLFRQDPSSIEPGQPERFALESQDVRAESSVMGSQRNAQTPEQTERVRGRSQGPLPRMEDQRFVLRDRSAIDQQQRAREQYQERMNDLLHDFRRQMNESSQRYNQGMSRSATMDAMSDLRARTLNDINLEYEGRKIGANPQQEQELSRVHRETVNDIYKLHEQHLNQLRDQSGSWSQRSLRSVRSLRNLNRLNQQSRAESVERPREENSGPRVEGSQEEHSKETQREIRRYETLTQELSQRTRQNIQQETVRYAMGGSRADAVANIRTANEIYMREMYSERMTHQSSVGYIVAERSRGDYERNLNDMRTYAEQQIRELPSDSTFARYSQQVTQAMRRYFRQGSSDERSQVPTEAERQRRFDTEINTALSDAHFGGMSEDDRRATINQWLERSRRLSQVGNAYRLTEAAHELEPPPLYERANNDLLVAHSVPSYASDESLNRTAAQQDVSDTPPFEREH